jgi:hypothetical protein
MFDGIALVPPMEDIEYGREVFAAFGSLPPGHRPID